MASGKNTLVRRIDTKMALPDIQQTVSGASTWLQGDFLVWDSGAKIVRDILNTDDGSTFLGIAPNSVTAGKIVGPYTGLTDVTEGSGSLEGPEYGDVHNVKAKSGDTFNPGDQVYPSQGVGQTREVTSTPGALSPIGVYQGAAVTAGASTEIELLIGCNFPDDTLKF